MWIIKTEKTGMGKEDNGNKEIDLEGNREREEWVKSGIGKEGNGERGQWE